ncbi:hypothetical protein INR49_011094 [Caranx melampygus]|nr:hypothetical protein INR49_011094 [Caranx melampygus]
MSALDPGLKVGKVMLAGLVETALLQLQGEEVSLYPLAVQQQAILFQSLEVYGDVVIHTSWVLAFSWCRMFFRKKQHPLSPLKPNFNSRSSNSSSRDVGQPLPGRGRASNAESAQFLWLHSLELSSIKVSLAARLQNGLSSQYWARLHSNLQPSNSSPLFANPQPETSVGAHQTRPVVEAGNSHMGGRGLSSMLDTVGRKSCLSQSFSDGDSKVSRAKQLETWKKKKEKKKKRRTFSVEPPLWLLYWSMTAAMQGFSLLGRDYGEKEEEESFELRNKEDLTPNGRSPAEVTVSQPTRTANGTNGLLVQGCDLRQRCSQALVGSISGIMPLSSSPAPLPFIRNLHCASADSQSMRHKARLVGRSHAISEQKRVRSNSQHEEICPRKWAVARSARWAKVIKERRAVHSGVSHVGGHTVSEVSEEMKSLIIEKNKMGLEEEPELLVKVGYPQATQGVPKRSGVCRMSRVCERVREASSSERGKGSSALRCLENHFEAGMKTGGAGGQVARSLLTTEEVVMLVWRHCHGWLLREVRGNWIKQRRYWFVLSQDSLDYYSGPEKGARRLGTLVLTNLCSVIWPDKQTYKETGYWSITVYGRKHCYRLYTKHFNEAVHWACAIQKIIDTKAPVETPTQLLIRDIEENKFNPEVVEHIYQHNPILKYTQGPLYAPLLPFPYGSLEHTYHSGKGYGSVREEAVKLFNCLQQLESAREPIPIIQGVLQTCLDLRPLRDEVYCQLVKQTSYTPAPYTAAHLRYWQLLTCMSCTFLPGPTVLKYLRFHLKRIQSQSPESEMDNYASFISEALEKTKCRECVPSWEEIQMLMSRQEMLCTVHYPGPGSCQLYISSHTTANEVVRRMQEKLGLQESKNTFALYEQNALWEQPVAGSALIADILTRFEK